MAGTIHVDGLAELNRALAQADRDVRLGIRKEFRTVAEPVRAEASLLARAAITNGKVPWNEMRVGITRNEVYVVPRQKGAKRNRARRRPNFSLLVYPAMQKALDDNSAEIERRFNEMLFTVAAKFNR